MQNFALFSWSPFAESYLIIICYLALHMHKTGTRMTNELIRDGKVINKAVSDVYDFDQQVSDEIIPRLWFCHMILTHSNRLFLHTTLGFIACSTGFLSSPPRR